MDNASESCDWLSILQSLAESEIDFLVVGGAALILHGIPRTTIDIDIFIPAEISTFSELLDLLSNKLGLVSKVDSLDKFLSDPDLLTGQWIPFAIPDGPDILDVYFCRACEFNTYSDSAEVIDFNGFPVNLADIDTLRKMKKNCGRSIDLADIALIDEYKSIKND